MTDKEFQNILSQGEGYNIEFKRSINKDLPKEICAFANASGGKIFIGVNDNNTVPGVKFNNKSASSLQNYISSVNPTPEVKVSEIKCGEKKVLVLDCHSGNQKPYMALGSIYIRLGANAQKLISPNEIRAFFQEQNKIYFDLSADSRFNYPEDFDNDTFEKFKQRVGIKSGNEQEIILQNLRLLNEDKQLRNAGILFFGKNPEQLFPHTAIRCMLFKGKNKRYIFDDKIFEGNLPKQFYDALGYLKQKLELRYKIEEQSTAERKEELELPVSVLREALINAIVHRDYEESGGKIHIEIYDNRIEISNPGGLIAAIPQTQFGKRSLSRNPLIFGLFMRMRLAEQVGSGILRMRENMRDAQLPAPEFHTEGLFVVTLYRPVDFEAWLENTDKQITKNQVHILRAIHADPNITHFALSEKLGLSTTAVGNNIKKLKTIKLLERMGSDKSGYWTLKT
jgi:ATP-dependent DNA helicase RecG